jgi:hypothetical protein
LRSWQTRRSPRPWRPPPHGRGHCRDAALAGDIPCPVLVRHQAARNPCWYGALHGRR